MPLIQIYTSAPAPAAPAKETLLADLSRLLSQTFQKPERWSMTCLLPNLSMTFRGGILSAGMLDLRDGFAGRTRGVSALPVEGGGPGRECRAAGGGGAAIIFGASAVHEGAGRDGGKCVARRGRGGARRRRGSV